MRPIPPHLRQSARMRIITNHIVTPSGCWEFLGATNNKGYGVMSIGKRPTFLAHCVAYTVCFGPIPDGLCVCHKCDHPPCVNPDHLFLGTHLDNMRDAIAKGRKAQRKRAR